MSSGSRCTEAPRVGRRKGAAENAGLKAEEKPPLVLVLLLGPDYKSCALAARSALEQVAMSCIKNHRGLLVYLGRTLAAQGAGSVQPMLARKPIDILPRPWQLQEAFSSRAGESVIDCIQIVLEDLRLARVHDARVAIVTDDTPEKPVSEPEDVLELANRGIGKLCLAGLLTDPRNKKTLAALGRSLKFKPHSLKVVVHNGQPIQALQEAIAWSSGQA